MRTLLASLVLAGLAGPAAACINDSELPTHEREFRSQYRGPAAPAEPPSAAPAGPVDNRLLAWAGGALLVGAVAVSALRVRAGD
jgi:hypothetical protein